MQTSDLFRWLFAATGLWLILSPFMIFSQSDLSQNAVSKEAGTLMCFGLLALIFACLSYNRHHVLQAGTGIILGAALIVSPLELGFAGNDVAVRNMRLAGLVVIVTAVFDLLRYRFGGVNE